MGFIESIDAPCFIVAVVYFYPLGKHKMLVCGICQGHDTVIGNATTRDSFRSIARREQAAGGAQQEGEKQQCER